MIDLTPIAKPIQKRLFEKMKLLGREGNSPNKPVSVGGLTHNQLAVRSPFIRMVSGLQDPVILMGGELINETSANFLTNTSRMAEGYDEIYGSRQYLENEADIFNLNWKPAIGGDNKFKRPMPGIKSMTAQFKGGIRAIREGTISWTCWSFEDINRLMPHFLAVGPSVLLEWGWVYGNNSLSQLPTFFSGDKKEIKKSAYNNYKNTIIKANGDFDMMVGIIKNFDFTTREDGGFDCTTTLTSAGVNTLGSVQPSIKKPAARYNLSAKDSDKVTQDKLKNAANNPAELIALNWSVSIKTLMKNIDIFLKDRVSKQLGVGGSGVSAEGGSYVEHGKLKEEHRKRQQKIRKSIYVTYQENEFIIVYKVFENKITKIKDAWVRWGWFEDNILSKFITQVGDDGITSEFRSVEKPIDEDGKEGPVYESVRIRNHPKLKTTNLSKYILPGQFFIQEQKEYGNINLAGDDTELKKLQTIVNNIDNFESFTTGDDTITTITESFFKDIVRHGDNTAEQGSGLIIAGSKAITAEEYTKGKAAAKRSGGTGKLLRKTTTKHQKTVVGPYGYLRNMLINTKLIKEAFGVSDDGSSTLQSITISEALRTMFRLLNEDVNIWKFRISADTTMPNRDKIIDTQITVPLPPVGINVNDSFAKLAGTRSTYNNATGAVHDGVFFFPVWRHDSLVKSQTLNCSIPDALAISAMYGNSYDSFKSGGEIPPEVSSPGTYSAGNLGKVKSNPPNKKNKNTDMALNSKTWSKIGTKPGIDSYVPLSKTDSDVDILDFFKRHTNLLKDSHTDRITSIEKNLEAAVEAGKETDVSDILNDTTPIVFLDDLIKMTTTNEDGETINVGEEAFDNIKIYKTLPNKKIEVTTKQQDDVDAGSKFLKLYSSIFETSTKDEKQIWKMKGPWLDAVRFDIMGKTSQKANISEQEQPLLLPLTLSISIDGIGGIFPGNSFHSTYVPKRYQEDATFQIFDVNHSVDSGGWSVELGGMMRSTMERVQRIEWETVTKEVIDALERFKKSKNRWDTKQLKDGIEAKIDIIKAGGFQYGITDKSSREDVMKKVVSEFGLSEAEEQVAQ